MTDEGYEQEVDEALPGSMTDLEIATPSASSPPSSSQYSSQSSSFPPKPNPSQPAHSQSNQSLKRKDPPTSTSPPPNPSQKPAANKPPSPPLVKPAPHKPPANPNINNPNMNNGMQANANVDIGLLPIPPPVSIPSGPAPATTIKRMGSQVSLSNLSITINKTFMNRTQRCINTIT